MTTPTLYDRLEITPQATPQEIKAAFRRLMRTYHPDVYGPGGEQKSAEISEAYTILGDPERRAAYDRDLADTPAEDNIPPQQDPAADYEPDWGNETQWDTPDDPHPGEGDATPEWGEEVVMDDAVVEDTPADNPTPPPNDPTPDPKGTPDREATPALRTPGRKALRATLEGLAACIPPACVWTLADPNPLAPSLTIAVIFLAVAATLGAVIGARVRTTSTSDQPRWAVARTIALAALITWLILLTGTLRALAAPIVVAVITACAQYVAAHYRSQQRHCDQIVPAPTVRDNNLFGTLPGDVASDLLDADLQDLVDDKAVRLLRCPTPGQPFSHALVRGDHVALLRAVIAPSGAYRWSGPSLMVTNHDPFPTPVINGPYAKALAAATATLGQSAHLTAWLVIYPTDHGQVTAVPDAASPHVGTAPQAVTAVRDFMAQADYAIDQRTITNTLLAMNS